MTKYWLLCGAMALIPQVAQGQSGPGPFTLGKRYDLSGRLVGEISPDPDGAGPLLHLAVRRTYDLSGLLILEEQGELANWQGEEVAPSNWAGFTLSKKASYSYDQADRLITKKVMDPSNIVRQLVHTSYEVNGREDCIAVRMDVTKFNNPYVTACSQISTDAANPDRITRYYYEPSGLKMQEKQGLGTASVSALVSYSRTTNGLVDSIVDGNGNRAKYDYDGHERISKWTFPSTTRSTAFNDASAATALATAGQLNTVDYEQYGYDANGNRTSLRKRDGSVLTSQYDALNRVAVKAIPERADLNASQSRDVYYRYNLQGLTIQLKFDSLSGEGITNSYNGFGELASSSNSMGGIPRTLAYSYDKNGKRVTITHSDGQIFNYARDGLDRVAGIYEGTSLTSTAQLLESTFNSMALLSSMARTNGTSGFSAGFGYDTVGRVASIANDANGTANDLTISQAMNPANQITSQTRNNDAYSWTGSVAVNRAYTTNGLNQYSAAGPASFTYDLNGNLTSDGLSSFVYDIENRLVRASGAKNAALVYDPMGRLWQVSGPGTDARFLYDGDELLAEFDSLGTMSRRYVHSDNFDDPVVLYDGAAIGSSNRAFLMPDERGSIAGLFYANGTVIKNTYDEYGIPGGSNQGRFQYTGQAWLPELGMYHYKARIYSPTLGRFLQVDPVAYDDQFNLYAYVGNDPVNNGDPDGKRRYGFNVEVKFAIGTVGYRGVIGFNYDNVSKEIGGSVTAGRRVGAQVGAKLEGYSEPSSKQGMHGKIAVEGVAEYAAELKAGPLKVGVSGQVTAGVSYSTKDGADASADHKESVSKGAVSQDSSGRTTYSIGGGLGAAAGVDVTISGNVPAPQRAQQGAPPPPRPPQPNHNPAQPLRR